MESISLVPSTPYDNSIYIADRKNCDGGLIMLEDRIIDYYMDVQETTAVSVDMSLLHLQPSSTIQFNLIVYSTGNNVLNLLGFNVEQIQVWNGESHFTIMKGVGDANWNIQMISSDTRPEQWLRCYPNLFNPIFTTGMVTVCNLYNVDSIRFNAFNTYAPNQTATDGHWGRYNYSENGEIYLKFVTPIWLKSACIGVTTSTSYTLSTFPTSLMIYGTNDGIEWTQILSTSLTPGYGSVDTYMCTTTNYYTMFKFKFGFTNTTTCYFPSVALTGFVGDLINTGSIKFAIPYLTTDNAFPFNGYNLETNASDMASEGGTLINLFNNSYSNYYETYFYDYSMTRNTGSDTPFEYIFTFPEAIRTLGISYNLRNEGAFDLFSLSYSDDKETWTEYCKVSGDAYMWTNNLNARTDTSYFCDSRSKHRYYKITVYSTYNNSNTLDLFQLNFLQYVPGIYFDFESFVPKLNSNAQSGYMLIASNSSDGDAYKMFDQSQTTYGGGLITDGEWSLLISLPQSTVVRGLEMVAPPSEYNRMPYAFTLQGSQDNDTWTDIKSFLLGSNYWSSALQLGQWDVENETAYSYYRLVVTNTEQGSYVRIGELGLSSYASFKGVNWYEDEYLVPVMSSNSQDGYIASASSSHASHPVYCIFDRSNGVNNKWFSDIVSGSWVKIELPTAQCANIFSIQTPNESNYVNRLPTVFKIQGSNDNSDWTDLVDVSGITWVNNETKTWVSDNTTNYKYYRILISANGGASNAVAIGEWTLIKRTYHNTLEGV